MADEKDLAAKAQWVAENKTQDPKSPVASYVLPCGHLDGDGNLIKDVVIREFKGVEEDILASDKLQANQKMEMVLTNTLVKLGSISDQEALAAILPKLPVGDRVFLLLSARRTTLGDTFPYVTKCPECKHKELFMVDLDELTIQPMPDPTKRVFDGEIPGGHTVRWHVMTGERENKISAFPLAQRKSAAVSLAILARLELLDDKPVNLPQIQQLSMGQRNALRDMFSECEGGVDTSVSFDCPNCGNEWEEELDISQQGFFFPLAAQRSWKRKSTS
jgi:hypothetical protein